MAEVIAAIIGTLLGVGLGHLLSERSAVGRERRAALEQRATVRTLLRLELTENRDAVRAWWQTISEGDNGSDEEPTRDQMARTMVERPEPATSRLMWESQAPALRIALSPRELRNAWRVYSAFVDLASYRAQLIAIARGDREAYMAAPEWPSLERGLPATRLGVPERFPGTAREWWPAIEATAQDALTLEVFIDDD